MAVIEKELIEKYNRSRTKTDKSLLCHAPFTNLNFEQNGNITACCYNRRHVLGTYPEQSIEEAWYSDAANELRNYIRKNDLGGGCSACAELLESGNFKGTKARFYDDYATSFDRLKSIFAWNQKVGMPKVFEFELSNTCNLECKMCNGYFSSSIRKNRENLPPLENPYDAAFIEQVAVFLPTITDLKYLGGEPFQIEIYLKLWEKVIEINPAIRNHITTNGTILNGRVKGLIENMKCGIILSIDSVKKETYEVIRKGADFDKVMTNLDYFMEYARRKNTYVSLTVCPIDDNAEEMPDMVRFANERNCRIHFNTVWTPDSVSLRFAEPNRLELLIESYNQEMKTTNQIQADNVNNLREFAKQLSFWHSEKMRTVNQNHEQTKQVVPFSSEELLAFPTLEKEILRLMQENYFEDAIESYPIQLKQIAQGVSEESFLNAYFDSITALHSRFEKQFQDFDRKTTALKNLIPTIVRKPEMVTDLIHTGVFYQIQFIGEQELEHVLGSVTSRYR